MDMFANSSTHLLSQRERGHKFPNKSNGKLGLEYPFYSFFSLYFAYFT
jgi:hypothetical protein